MSESQNIVTLIKSVSRHKNESDFLEHPHDFTFSFALGMLLTCVLGFSLLGLAMISSTGFLWLQEKWKRLNKLITTR